MAQLEELLEKKPDAVSEDMGYSTPSDAYPEDEWEKQKLKGWPRQIHVFGMRQNQINRGTAARLRALEIQNRTLEIKIQRLEEELEGLAAREKKILGRIAAEMDTMQAEINRLRLSTQLNSNALDRILRQPEPESAEKENDSQESQLIQNSGGRHCKMVSAAVHVCKHFVGFCRKSHRILRKHTRNAAEKLGKMPEQRLLL